MSTRVKRWLPVVALVLCLVAPAIPAGAQGATTHIVRPGETLSLIARRFGTTVSAIAQANGLRNPNFIWWGQQLRIPASTPGSGSENRIHVVRWGDTLARIARRYDTSVTALVRANGLSNANRIYAGQRLMIPGSGDVPVDPTVTITPTSGPSGTSVQVVASGFPSNSPVSVGLGPANSEFGEVARGTTDANGSFTVRVSVQGAQGMNWIFGVNAGGVHATSVPFHTIGAPEPTVTISPTSGPSGTSVQVVASGFPSNSPVSVGLGPVNSEFGDVAHGTTDANGSFTVRVPVRGAQDMNWIFGVNAGGVHATSVSFRITDS
jgi:LysM repeat protein